MAVMNALYDVEVSATTTTAAASTSASTKKTTSSSKNATYKDGTYTGEGDGFKGTVKVQVKIKNSKIKSVKIVSHEDDAPYFNKAKKLTSTVVKKQTTDVDTVSGATYSSNGILSAIDNALSKAETKSAKASSSSSKSSSKKTSSKSTSSTKKSSTSTQKSATTQCCNSSNDTANDTSNTSATTQVSAEGASQTDASTQAQGDNAAVTTQAASGYKDGDYEIVTTCNPDDSEDFEPYQLHVKVTIKNGVITAISDVKGVGDDYDTSNNSFIKMAVSGNKSQTGAVEQIIKKGTPDGIDAVSGATCSVNAIVKACKEALAKAKQ